MTIHYTVTLENAHAHLIDVHLRIENVHQTTLNLSLPNWIPGSYLIRDFAKNLIDMSAKDGNGNTLEIRMLDKSHWQVLSTDENVLGSVQVSYQVYAWDLSVRTAHFDQTHAFFNGTSVFLRVDDFADAPYEISLPKTKLTEQQGWRVASTLPKVSTDAFGFGDYRAANYRDLIEYPVEVSDFVEVEFVANGVPHRIAFTGKFERHKLNKEQLIKDLTAICETELSLFGAPYPFVEYLFQVMVTDNGYGGLEHTNSTALLCSRSDLPYTTDAKRTDGYIQFLELCAHEYFHSWNVKRIQPAVYQASNLSEPVYTNQLWWFEGITSYFDGLFLNMAGLVDSDTYLKRLSKEMTRVYRMPGRFKQSVAESSITTWTKFYQQDENAPNAIISYYTKGSLIGLGLDLLIRQQTQNQKTLVDVLKALWQKHGLPRKGLLEGEIEQLCEEVSGIDLTDFFKQHLFDKEDLPFEGLFSPFGVDFTLRPATGLKDTGGSTEETNFPVQLGANLQTTEHQTVRVTHVWNDMALHNAGVATSDEIIALNGYKMASTDAVESFLKGCELGDKVICHYFRRDELMKTEIQFNHLVSDRVVLEKNNQYGEALSWLKN
ncbi:M61 family metallopeptidase [Hydrogenovibrio sp. JE_KL2]|uniref:M61 family metallopeptidase n=1 Tax=Hydrogenovibrio sp. JE_KL2 TaxID=2651188 RepID=UPI00128D5B79|nr:PDZ domain-containing protein [Hydrogenovibrio sp. JE_KL2]MPQ76014.1 M61 family metallopeptidase [Hydrogenovibrio sp. JE_KL2]